MNKQFFFIGIYAFLILSGGLIGFLAAKSLISLVVSSVFSLILFSCSYFGRRGYPIAYHIAMISIFCLVAFFAYRFSLTYKLMPSGMMGLISGALFSYLFFTKKQMANFPIK